MKNYSKQIASISHRSPVRDFIGGNLAHLFKFGGVLLCAISLIAAEQESAADKFVKELVVVLNKAKAGDKSSKQTFGDAFWNTDTNQTGTRFIDLTLPTIREQMLSDESKWFTAEQKVEMRELLRKGDAGDKVARGDAALMAMDDMFQMLERRLNETNSIPAKPRSAGRLERSDENGLR